MIVLKADSVGVAICVYIESKLPMYDLCDPGHNQTHIRHVIKTAEQWARKLKPNNHRFEMKCKTAAAFHDIGLALGADRDVHEQKSAEFVENDSVLNSVFGWHEIEEIADAVRNHRASNFRPSESLMAKIIRNADATPIDTENAFYRAYVFRDYLKYDLPARLEKAAGHLWNKYNPQSGYAVLYPPGKLFHETKQAIFEKMSPIFRSYLRGTAGLYQLNELRKRAEEKYGNV